MSVLEGIMGPAQADIMGNMDKGRERQSTDMAGDILGQTMGGQLGALARLSPEKMMVVAEATGIPISSKGRVNAFMGTNMQASELIKAGMHQEAAQVFAEAANNVRELTGDDAQRYIAAANGIAQGDQEMMGRIVQSGDAFKQMAMNGGKQGGMASAKTEILSDGTTIQSLPDGTTQVINPAGSIVTGQERIETLKASKKSSLNTKQAEADIAVAEAQGKAIATQRASRISSLTSDMSERNRSSSRNMVRLNQAFKIAEVADQGVTGAGKLQLAKLFPEIDATNEALLAQSLKGLALDQLQKFKGPTTDFEFGVTEDIAGSLGDSKTANIARIKSLQRAEWFNKREFDQFQDHIKANKNPDTFGFDFGERVKTKKGEFSLQDLQDTAVSKNLTIDEVIKELNK
jgi:hypothetical protein